MFFARTTMLILAVLAAASTAPTGSTRANDWPCWRGPERTGVSSETGLLSKWPEGGPKLLWTTKGLGIGFSTPAIAKGRIYLLGTAEGKEQAIALDGKDGKKIWSKEIGEIAENGPPSWPGPRSTPTVDGDRLYVLGSDGNLVCFDIEGKEIWRKNLDKDFNGSRGRWAYAESPLIDGDVLVCTPGGKEATLVALNKKTGAVIWKASVPKGNQAAYASPIVCEGGGIKQYVQFLGGNLVGVAAKDGKLLWNYNKVTGITNCTTPVFHDGCVFVSASGGRRGGGGAALVKLTADGGGVTAKEVWHIKTLANHHGGVVRIGDALYGTNNTGLLCIDFKTGETKWQNRSMGKGSVAAADGHLYVRGEKGPVALVEATPAEYKQTGRFDQPSRSKGMAWPHPVIANGRLYLHDADVLLCFDVKAE
jgi:outer membrane protein assembly factor BamB